MSNICLWRNARLLIYFTGKQSEEMTPLPAVDRPKRTRAPTRKVFATCAKVCLAFIKAGAMFGLTTCISFDSKRAPALLNAEQTLAHVGNARQHLAPSPLPEGITEECDRGLLVRCLTLSGSDFIAGAGQPPCRDNMENGKNFIRSIGKCSQIKV